MQNAVEVLFFKFEFFLLVSTKIVQNESRRVFNVFFQHVSLVTSLPSLFDWLPCFEENLSLREALEEWLPGQEEFDRFVRGNVFPGTSSKPSHSVTDAKSERTRYFWCFHLLLLDRKRANRANLWRYKLSENRWTPVGLPETKQNLSTFCNDCSFALWYCKHGVRS